MKMGDPLDWDINDVEMPQVFQHDYFHEWVDGHVKLVYHPEQDEAKRHSSGWAMRNTNNHNVVILKKSCLGVLVCSKSCTDEYGEKTRVRPAICDKARRKQQGRSCPNSFCTGIMVVMPCRGHCGYPVTHFWRHTPQGVFFQSKGVHDHPKPEPKTSADVKKCGRTTARSKSSANWLHKKDDGWNSALKKNRPVARAMHESADDPFVHQGSANYSSSFSCDFDPNGQMELKQGCNDVYWNTISSNESARSLKTDVPLSVDGSSLYIYDPSRYHAPALIRTGLLPSRSASPEYPSAYSGHYCTSFSPPEEFSQDPSSCRTTLDLCSHNILGYTEPSSAQFYPTQFTQPSYCASSMENCISTESQLFKRRDFHERDEEFDDNPGAGTSSYSAIPSNHSERNGSFLTFGNHSSNVSGTGDFSHQFGQDGFGQHSYENCFTTAAPVPFSAWPCSNSYVNSDAVLQ